MSETSERSKEEEALLKLQEMGVWEIGGESVADLLELARRRYLAQSLIREVEMVLRETKEAWQPETANRMQEAYQKALEARRVLQGITYPEAEKFFAPRRDALEADLMRINGLFEAIDVWWWCRFSEAIARFHLNRNVPASIEGAKDALAEARGILGKWPQGSGPRRNQAERTLSSLEDEFAQNIETLLREAEIWVNQAMENQDSPLLALHCAAKAQTILDDLEGKLGLRPADRTSDAINVQYRGGDSAIMPPQKSQEQMRALRRKLDEIRKRLREEAPVYLRQEALSSLTTPLGEASEDFLFEKDEQSRQLRNKTDELATYLYLDPAVESRLDPKIKRLVWQRRDNRVEATLLRLEAQALLRLPTQERLKQFGRIHSALKRAVELDPDDKESETLLRKAEDEMRYRLEDVAKELGRASRDLDELEGKGPAFVRQSGLEAVGKRLDDLKTKLQRARAEIQSYQLYDLPNYLATLSKLEQDIARNDGRCKRLQQPVEVARQLIQKWKAGDTSGDTLSRTRELAEVIRGLPESIRDLLREELFRAIREALPKIRERAPSSELREEMTCLFLLWRRLG